MKFNPEQALEYARRWARPRRVGMDEEARVAEEITALLESFGWRVTREPFEFVPLFNVVLTLELLLGEMLIALVLWRPGTVWAVVGAVGLLGLVAGFGMINRAAQRAGLTRLTPRPPLPKTEKLSSGEGESWLRRYRTANIVAELPHRMHSTAETQNRLKPVARPCLYLVAHYDSKSQRLPLALRMALFGLMLGGAVIFAGLTLGQSFWPGVSEAATGAGWAAWLAGLPLLFMQDVGNESPGAIDNASGAGLVAHIAECLASERAWQDELQVRILITSAEEFALMGAVAYVQKHRAELDEQARGGGLLILNFDGVGVKGRLGCVGNTTVGATHAPSLRFFNLPGALFDHIPFAEAGFEAVSLVTIGRASLAVHTRGDDTDKLDVEGFRQAGEWALKVIERLGDLAIGSLGH